MRTEGGAAGREKKLCRVCLQRSSARMAAQKSWSLSLSSCSCSSCSSSSRSSSFAVFVFNVARLGWLLKKVCLHTRRQKAQTFPPWGGRATTFEESTGANSQSSTRVKTVNRGKHGTERENTRNNQNSIWRKNTNVFFLLPDIAADKPATDL